MACSGSAHDDAGWNMESRISQHPTYGRPTPSLFCNTSASAHHRQSDPGNSISPTLRSASPHTSTGTNTGNLPGRWDGRSDSFTNLPQVLPSDRFNTALPTYTSLASVQKLICEEGNGPRTLKQSGSAAHTLADTSSGIGSDIDEPERSNLAGSLKPDGNSFDAARHYLTGHYHSDTFTNAGKSDVARGPVVLSRSATCGAVRDYSADRGEDMHQGRQDLGLVSPTEARVSTRQLSRERGRGIGGPRPRRSTPGVSWGRSTSACSDQADPTFTYAMAMETGVVQSNSTETVLSECSTPSDNQNLCDALGEKRGAGDASNTHARTSSDIDRRLSVVSPSISSRSQRVAKHGVGKAKRVQPKRAQDAPSSETGKKNRQGSSEYRGVSWHLRSKHWRATIYFGKKPKHLGYFTDQLSAAEAYDLAAVVLRDGDGATKNLNFPKNIPKYEAIVELGTSKIARLVRTHRPATTSPDSTPESLPEQHLTATHADPSNTNSGKPAAMTSKKDNTVYRRLEFALNEIKSEDVNPTSQAPAPPPLACPTASASVEHVDQLVSQIAARRNQGFRAPNGNAHPATSLTRSQRRKVQTQRFGSHNNLELPPIPVALAPYQQSCPQLDADCTFAVDATAKAQPSSKGVYNHHDASLRFMAEGKDANNFALAPTKSCPSTMLRAQLAGMEQPGAYSAYTQRSTENMLMSLCKEEDLAMDCDDRWNNAVGSVAPLSRHLSMQETFSHLQSSGRKVEYGDARLQVERGLHNGEASRMDAAYTRVVRTTSDGFVDGKAEQGGAMEWDHLIKPPNTLLKSFSVRHTSAPEVADEFNFIPAAVWDQHGVSQRVGQNGTAGGVGSYDSTEDIGGGSEIYAQLPDFFLQPTPPRIEELRRQHLMPTWQGGAQVVQQTREYSLQDLEALMRSTKDQGRRM